MRYGIGFASIGTGDAVTVEVTEAAAQFAPCRKQARVVTVAWCQRPDGAVGIPSFSVGVVDVQTACRAQGMAYALQDVCFARAVRVFCHHREHSLRSGVIAPFFAGHVTDFVNHAPGGFGQIIIALGNGTAHTEDQRFGFSGIKGERRQEEVGAVQDVTGTRSAPDVRSLFAQGFDVAVEGTQTDAEGNQPGFAR